jgi:hypothetical protein
MLLRGLMEDPTRLRCLTPPMNQEVAVQVAAMAHDDPQAFDDLDVQRIAAFLNNWAPMQAAQVGCRIDAAGEISRLGQAIGCTSEHKDRLLTRYRYRHPLPAGGGAPALDAGAEVILVWEGRDRCEVRPATGPTRVVTVACADLDLVSGVEVAVLIEQVTFGVARADLIAGLVTYAGDTRAVTASEKDPEVKTWFAYSRTGSPLGTTRMVRLERIGRSRADSTSEKSHYVKLAGMGVVSVTPLAAGSRAKPWLAGRQCRSTAAPSQARVAPPQ